MKNVEYAPRRMPTSSAKAKSLSVSPPKKSRHTTGRRLMNVVFSDRVSISTSDSFTRSP